MCGLGHWAQVWSQEWQGIRPVPSGELDELFLEVGSSLFVRRTRAFQVTMLIGGLSVTWLEYKKRLLLWEVLRRPYHLAGGS